MTNSAWQATIQNDSGDIVPTAEITVIDEGTGLNATIFSTRGGAALANPFTVDSNGFAQFYASFGEYRIEAVEISQGIAETWRYVRLGDGGSQDISIGTDFDQIPLNTDIVYPVVNVAALRALEPAASGQNAYINGHTDAGIGGDNWFYDAADASSVDNGIDVVVTPLGARWKKASFTDINKDFFAPSATLGEIIVFASNENKGIVFDRADQSVSASTNLPSNTNINGGSLTSTGLAETLRATASSEDVTLTNVKMVFSNGIAIQQNAADCKDWRVINCDINSSGYGILTNSAGVNSDVFITAFSKIISINDDAIEYNDTDDTSSNRLAIGNVLSGGLSGSSASSGFGVGVAATKSHITVANMITGARQEALHAEDQQERGVFGFNTATNLNSHGILTLAPNPIDVAVTTGIISVGNHLNHTSAIATSNGIREVLDGNGGLEGSIHTSNYLKGFGIGARLTRGTKIVDGNVFDNSISVAVLAQGASRSFGTNVVRGSVPTPTLMEGVGFTRLGKVVCDYAPTTILNYTGGATEVGVTSSGFAIKIPITHTSTTGIEVVGDILTLDTDVRLQGKIQIVTGSANNAFYAADITWDGAAVTLVNVVSKHFGTMASTTFIDNSGRLAVQAFSTGTLSTVGYVEFDGVYYTK